MKIPFLKEALKNLFKKPITEDDNLNKEIEGYRGKIEFHSEKCIGCGLCTRVCASNSIEKIVEKLDEDTERVTLIFDLASCTFCSMCSDFCMKKAITLTNDWNIVTKDKDELIVKGSFNKKVIKKSNIKN